MKEGLNKLKQLEGKEFGYKGFNYTGVEAKLVNSVLVLKTSKRTFNFTENEIDVFINEIHSPLDSKTELKQNEVAISSNKVEIFKPLTHNEEIKNTLMDTLRKLKDKTSTPEEANAVCNVVNQFVNLQKNEIQIISLLNK